MDSLDQKPQRDARRTRAAILAAAQEAFSTHGYIETGVREITAAAGVNPALVSRYFGSKERLFEEALSDLLDANVLTASPRADFGEAVVRLLTEPSPPRRNPLPMMLLASGDPAARTIVSRLLVALTLAPLSTWLGGAEAESRAARFVALAAGLTFYRQVYPLPKLAGDIDDPTRRWLVAAFQSLADG